MSQSATKACVSRHTARKYLSAGQGPEEVKKEHTWRTRKDPFTEVWGEVELMLGRAPELQAGTIFEVLQEKHPGRFPDGQLRTLQRHVKSWKLIHGKPQEVYFSQEHQPGRRVQVDWTPMNELGITVGGEPYRHLLFHMVLPYSNWQWGNRCQSESMLSLRNGTQQGLRCHGLSPVAKAMGNAFREIAFRTQPRSPERGSASGRRRRRLPHMRFHSDSRCSGEPNSRMALQLG